MELKKEDIGKLVLFCFREYSCPNGRPCFGELVELNGRKLDQIDVRPSYILEVPEMCGEKPLLMYSKSKILRHYLDRTQIFAIGDGNDISEGIIKNLDPIYHPYAKDLKERMSRPFFKK